MTRETYEKAGHIDHDISVLNDIKFEQDKQHWVGFRSPGLDKIDSFWTSEIIDDFKKFVNDEIEKAEKMLEEL